MIIQTKQHPVYENTWVKVGLNLTRKFDLEYGVSILGKQIRPYGCTQKNACVLFSNIFELIPQNY